MHLIFYSSEGWQPWGLGTKPLIPEGMPVLIDADLLFEDAGLRRITVVINRWLRDLPSLGVPAVKSWEYYARVLRDWTIFLPERGCNAFADRQRLKSVLSAYAVHRASASGAWADGALAGPRAATARPEGAGAEQLSGCGART